MLGGLSGGAVYMVISTDCLFSTDRLHTFGNSKDLMARSMPSVISCDEFGLMTSNRIFLLSGRVVILR